MVFAQFPLQKLGGALASFFLYSSNRNRGKAFAVLSKKKTLLITSLSGFVELYRTIYLNITKTTVSENAGVKV